MKPTAKNIKLLPDGKHSAGDGLVLLVAGSSRNWVFRYQMNGKRYDYGLGSALTLSISDAREKIRVLRNLIAQGKNPKEVRKQERLSPKEESPVVIKAPTFNAVAKEALAVIESVRRWKNKKHAAQWRTTIRTYASPEIGKKQIDEITRDDVLKILRPIWEEKTETASRLRGRLEAVFDYAISKGLITQNPARWKANLESFLPSPSKIQHEEHFASMPLDMTQTFVRRLNPVHVSHAMILVGILTAARAQEVLGMRWDEIDFESNTWCVDPSRTKTSVPHRVPLSRQVIRILKSLPRTSKFGLVFPSPLGDHQMSVDTPRITIQKLTKCSYTMHGFRSTFRDWGEENLIHDTLLEKALSHSQKSKTVRAYQRSDLLDQRRPVMQQWADVILPEG